MKILANDEKNNIELDKDSVLKFYPSDNKRNCIRVYFNEDGSISINGDSAISIEPSASNSINVKIK